jgi:hypothetical protein
MFCGLRERRVLKREAGRAYRLTLEVMGVQLREMRHELHWPGHSLNTKISWDKIEEAYASLSAWGSQDAKKAVEEFTSAYQLFQARQMEIAHGLNGPTLDEVYEQAYNAYRNFVLAI